MVTGIVRTLASKVAGPVLVYIVLALGLGMVGTGLYVKYLKNKNLSLLQTVAGLGGALYDAENDKEQLRYDIERLDILLTKQRKDYQAIDGNTTQRVEDIYNEEITTDEFTDGELNRLRMW